MRAKFGTELVDGFRALNLEQRSKISYSFRRELPQWQELFDAFYPRVRVGSTTVYGINALGLNDNQLGKPTQSWVSISYDANGEEPDDIGASTEDEKKIEQVRQSLLRYAWNHILTSDQKIQFQLAYATFSGPQVDFGVINQAYTRFNQSSPSQTETNRRANSYIGGGIAAYVDRTFSPADRAQLVQIPHTIGTDNSSQPVTQSAALTYLLKRYLQFRLPHYHSPRTEPVEQYATASIFLQRASDFAYRGVMHLSTDRPSGNYLLNEASVLSTALPQIRGFFSSILESASRGDDLHPRILPRRVR